MRRLYSALMAGVLLWPGAGCSWFYQTTDARVKIPAGIAADGPGVRGKREWVWRVFSPAGMDRGRIKAKPGERIALSLPREVAGVILLEPRLPGGEPFWAPYGRVFVPGEGAGLLRLDAAGGVAGEMLLQLFRQDPGLLCLFNMKRFAETVREELGTEAWKMDREKVYSLWEEGRMRETAVDKRKLRDGWWGLPRPGVWCDRSGWELEAGAEGGVWVEDFPVGCRELLHWESGERVWVEVPAEGEILAGPAQ